MSRREVAFSCLGLGESCEYVTSGIDQSQTGSKDASGDSPVGAVLGLVPERQPKADIEQLNLPGLFLIVQISLLRTGIAPGWAASGGHS
jgi:hypothetical protein